MKVLRSHLHMSGPDFGRAQDKYRSININVWDMGIFTQKNLFPTIRLWETTFNSPRHV